MCRYIQYVAHCMLPLQSMIFFRLSTYNSSFGHAAIRYGTTDDLRWKTERQAASLTVRLHMGVIFDPTVRYAAIASVLFDILLSASMTL